MPVPLGMLAGIVVTLMVALTCDAARAETVADTLARWGMVGAWAPNCNAPASLSNVYLSYRVDKRGGVVLARYYGEGSDANPILSAGLLDNGMLEFVVNYRRHGRGLRRLAVTMGPDGRVRAIRNTRMDGTDPAVRDGKLVQDGTDMPWQTRCS